MASRTQSISDRPTAIQAFGDAVVREACVPSPCGNALRTIIMRQLAYATTVLSLLLASCPSTVIWSVVAVVVDAVEFEPNGNFAHVGEELFKGFDPLGANLNTATPIVSIASMVFIQAPHTHRRPCSICTGLRHSMSNLQFGSACSQFDVEATAAASHTVFHRRRLLGYEYSTIALAVPHSSWAAIGGTREYEKSSISVSG